MKCPNCLIDLKLINSTYKCNECIFVSAENYLKIDQMFAFVSVDKEGNEGIAAFMGPQGPMPMVGADLDRVKSLKPIAQRLGRAGRMKMKLIRFSTREDLETFEP